MKCRCSNCGWLEVNPSGAMFCGYSDERTSENESCLAWKDKNESLTNADRIRAMTDEELAEFLEFVNDGDCLYVMGRTERCGNCGGEGCPCWLEWLKEEAENGAE